MLRNIPISRVFCFLVTLSTYFSKTWTLFSVFEVCFENSDVHTQKHRSHPSSKERTYMDNRALQRKAMIAKTRMDRQLQEYRHVAGYQYERASHDFRLQNTQQPRGLYHYPASPSISKDLAGDIQMIEDQRTWEEIELLVDLQDIKDQQEREDCNFAVLLQEQEMCNEPSENSYAEQAIGRVSQRRSGPTPPMNVDAYPADWSADWSADYPNCLLDR
jgi:hypothetical protein